MSVTLFMPVLNEREGLEIIVPRIPKGVFDQILLVDGGSTDGTIEWAKQNNIEIVSQKKRGLRHAYIEGYEHIRSEWVMTFSPDGNCLPEDISKIIQTWKANPDADMVIGSRYLGGKRSADDDIVTAFGNWMFTTIINLCFHGKYTDVMNIFRMYRKKMFYDLDIHREESHNTEKLFFTVVGVEPLISIRAAKRKLKNVDVYCEEPKRIHGVRKLQILRWGGSHLLQVVKEVFWWR